MKAYAICFLFVTVIIASSCRAAGEARPFAAGQETFINKPELVPTSKPVFSDELFREEVWHLYQKEKVVDEPLRDSLAVVQYSLNVVFGGAEVTERFAFANPRTVMVGPLALDIPGSQTQKSTPDRPLVQHRLEFGPPEGRGPRVSLLFAEADGAAAFDVRVGAAGSSPDTTPFTSGSKGSHRRTRLTLSWPIRARMFNGKVEEVRCYGGWQFFEDDYSRRDLSTALFPGEWAIDELETQGPTVGIQGGWALSAKRHFFFETGLTVVQMTGTRAWRLPGLTYRYDGDGWGWDALMGVRHHRGPLTYEVAMLGYGMNQTNGSGYLRYRPTLIEHFSAKETELVGYGLTVGATYRF